MEVLSFIVFFLALAATAAWAGPSFAPSDYRFSKPVGTTGSGEFACVELDADVYAAAREDLADLRLQCDGAAEAPWLLERKSVARRVAAEVEVEAVTDDLKKDDRRIEVFLHLKDPAAGPPTRMAVHTPLRDFERKVSVHGRRPGGEWRALAEERTICDYTRFMDLRRSSIALPASDCTEFRVTVDCVTDIRSSGFYEITRLAGDRYTFHHAWPTDEVKSLFIRYDFRIDKLSFHRTVTREEAPEDALRELELTGFTTRIDAKAKATEIEIPTGRLPLRGLELQTSTLNFSRPVQVLAWREGGPGAAAGSWARIAQGSFTSVCLDGLREQSLSIGFPEERSPRLLLRIEDGDNPPLVVDFVRAKATVHRLLFLPEPGRSYRLFYGNAAATRPSYDLGAVLGGMSPAERAAKAQVCPLGPALATPVASGGGAGLAGLFANRLVLWGAVALILAGLSWAMLVAFRRVGKLKDPDAG